MCVSVSFLTRPGGDEYVTVVCSGRCLIRDGIHKGPARLRAQYSGS